MDGDERRFEEQTLPDTVKDLEADYLADGGVRGEEYIKAVAENHTTDAYTDEL